LAVLPILLPRHGELVLPRGRPVAPPARAVHGPGRPLHARRLRHGGAARQSRTPRPRPQRGPRGGQPALARLPRLRRAAGRGSDPAHLADHLDGGRMADGQPVSAKPGTAAPADAHRETTPGAGAVSLVNLAKSFGGTPVIRDFSLEIRPHEFIVFLGPSGCGKSTLLRLVAGLETLDAGEIHIDGRRVDGLKPGERGVAMVFQHYALYPHMTVRENMAFGLRNLSVPRDQADRRVAQAADMLEIADLLERKPGQISGGQRQRVAIGRAIVKEPRLFLFDEPLSNLDAALRVRTRLEIAQLHQRVDASTIFVTHDQVEAMTLADRIVVMRDGRVEQIGTPMEIYDRPATEFVASFV